MGEAIMTWVEQQRQWVPFIHKVWDHMGLLCIVMEPGGEGTGFTGYVGLDKDHPFYEWEYSENYDTHLDVHGGVTFSGTMPKEIAEPELWYIGFDMKHGFDYESKIEGRKYYIKNLRTIDEAIENTQSLCEQIIDWCKALDPAYELQGNL